MPKQYNQITADERDKIAVYLAGGFNYSDIARMLGRNRSSIMREINPVTVQNNIRSIHPCMLINDPLNVNRLRIDIPGLKIHLFVIMFILNQA